MVQVSKIKNECLDNGKGLKRRTWRRVAVIQALGCWFIECIGCMPYNSLGLTSCMASSKR